MAPSDFSYLQDDQSATLQHVLSIGNVDKSKSDDNQRMMQLCRLFPRANYDLIELLHACLEMDPSKRITAKECLEMDIFEDIRIAELEVECSENVWLDVEELDDDELTFDAMINFLKSEQTKIHSSESSKFFMGMCG